jgi:hypothetical protein
LDSELTLDEATALLKGGLGKALKETAASYIAPIFWDRSNGAVENNGTIFFLNCGEGPFAVTADHVFKKYLEEKEEHTNICCQVGNMRIDLEERLIDHDDQVDIATFRITEEEVKQLGKTILTGQQTEWPPPPPTEGKGVFFAGFPGKERLDKPEGRIDFGIYAASCTAFTVSNQMVKCKFEREFMIDTMGLGLPAEGHDTGGVSGAPLLTLVEHKGIVSWRLAGVIYSGKPEWEMILARRADYILKNGMIKKPL